VFFATVSSSVATLACAMGGYALAKFRFSARGPLTALVLGALIIPSPLLIAPSYQLLWQLGLLNSYSGLILPALAPAFGVFLFRQAMLNTVPAELLESARMDGAGEYRIFFTIVIPLVRPMIGAFLLITFLGAWNNFIGPQIVLQEPEVLPLSVKINNLRGLYATDYGLIMAGTLISIAPVMCLFLLLQKEFISGLTSGAVKG
jgi:multiple sugar transport system permease protein